MRVLFSTTAGTGHFGPLIPVARVCQAAGHTVAVAAPARFAEAVTGAEFDHLPFADPSPELRGKVFGRAPQRTFDEMNRLVLAEVFARLDAQAALPALSEIMIDWRPVVREPCEFGSLVAAESAGIPQLRVAIMTGRIGPGILSVVRESLAELSSLAGLLPERAAGVLLQADCLTSVPEALDSGDLMLGGAEAEEAVSDRGRMWRFRTDTPVKPKLPATWGDPADPLIYVSYGSVTAQPEFSPIYDATLQTLADLPVRVLMTTGRGFDVGQLEPIPPNTHVEQWWPQEAVMGAAAAVVGHGGFGTTMAALAAGVPQVVVPLFAFDQSVHARRVAEVNAGIQLPGGLAAVADLPAALRRVLDDPAFARGARAMAAETAALPDIAECLPLLEQLASNRVFADEQ
jgi:glycosyltransferase